MSAPDTTEPTTIGARRITSNSRGPGQDAVVFHQVDRLQLCLKCNALRHGDGPHSPRWGYCPAGHYAQVDCQDEMVKPCSLCAQKPWPAPALEHVELRDARTGLTLFCRRCRCALGFSDGDVQATVDAFEEKHLFCRETP
jgi:hypothetical protein